MSNYELCSISDP